MKKLTKIFALFLTLLTLLFSENIYAQNNYNKTDKQGRRQGKWIEYHSNGQIRYKGQFKNNEPVGEFLYYSENGSLFAKNKNLKNNVTESEQTEEITETQEEQPVIDIENVQSEEIKETDQENQVTEESESEAEAYENLFTAGLTPEESENDQNVEESIESNFKE